jgi:hypothetical protein
MMSAAAIRNISRQAAARAARNHQTPFIMEQEDLDETGRVLRHIPFLGNYLPKGFEKVDEYFVDSSGFGKEGEPALTFRQFCAKVRQNGSGYGYGITEAGQFQVYIGVYSKNGSVSERRATQ